MVINLLIGISDDVITIGIELTDDTESLEKILLSSFPRRYLPNYSLHRGLDRFDVLIKWIKSSNGFKIINFQQIGHYDEFVIESPLPEPYVNESPVFFLLQVFARAYVKKNYLVLTDSIALKIRDRTILLLGYPHSGKSTLTALSINYGDTPLSTENTVLELTSNGLRVVNGTSILVYDPRVEELYGVKINYTGMTKHGYRIVDLDEIIPKRKTIIKNKPFIDEIYILHCSFNSGEPGLEKVVGRKIKKTLWYFISSLLIGIDYYEPHPLYLVNQDILEKLVNFLNKVSEIYSDKVFEIYGSHDKTYQYLRKM